MTDDLVFNPHTYDPKHFDKKTPHLLRATIDWLESRGKTELIKNYSTVSGTRTSWTLPPRRGCSRPS